ncbi:MAG: lysophospholipid acyltransferase family protein [bacterium]
MKLKSKQPNPIILWAIGWIIPAWIRLVNATTRWQVIGQKNYDAAIKNKDGFIVAFWHSRIMMMVPVRLHYPGRFYFMISEHRDGTMIAKGVEAFNIDFARGSARNLNKKFKEKGGAKAMRVLLSALKDGSAVGMTPDGPRGPRQKCQIGLVRLALASGKPIIPVAYAIKGSKIFNSWDRFHWPMPFSKGCYVYGEPIMVTAETEQEQELARQQIEQAINQVTAAADRQVGISETANG